MLTALINSGYGFTFGRTTVNLAPADVRKEGPSFDLPIAICARNNGRAGLIVPAENAPEAAVAGLSGLDPRQNVICLFWGRQKN